MKKGIFAALAISLFLVQTFAVAVAYAEPPNGEVDKVVFVHYANNSKARPPPQQTGTYKLMGIKWSTNALPVKFAVNSLDSGLGDSSVKSAILLAANEWDDGTYSQSEGLKWYGTTANLYSDYSDTTVPTTSATKESYDGTNEIFWGSLSSGTIAVTTVWYNRFTKQILEFDMEFNTYYVWGTDGSPSKMDLQNIATHELGHSVGLADLYTSSASQETMYGYSNYGVLKARDLYNGDQAGIKKLYG